MTRLLDDWEKALHSDWKLPTLVVCALTHYQFEAIHPFLDGNGRVGRLVAILFLIEQGVVQLPLLNLSAYFAADRGAYYDGLLSVSTEGSWDQWIRYFLRGVGARSLAGVADSERLLAVRDELRRRLVSERSRPTALRLADQLFINPFMTAQNAARLLSVSEPAAQAAIRQLAAMGVLREVTGQQRRRVYIAEDVLRAIEGRGPTAQR